MWWFIESHKTIIKLKWTERHLRLNIMQDIKIFWGFIKEWWWYNSKYYKLKIEWFKEYIKKRVKINQLIKNYITIWKRNFTEILGVITVDFRSKYVLQKIVFT